MADDESSNRDIDETITEAEAGSQAAGDHAPRPGDTGDARTDEIRDVERPTTIGDDGDPASSPEAGLSPTETGSGGAQNIAGARIPDRAAAGQPLPDEPPFDSRSGGSSD